MSRSIAIVLAVVAFAPAFGQQKDSSGSGSGRIMPPVLRTEPSEDRGYDNAQALEAAGRNADAVKAYKTAALKGNGKAAFRLGQIYERGILGVAADLDESRKWYNAARVMGARVP